jgi:hypothetical protein
MLCNVYNFANGEATRGIYVTEHKEKSGKVIWYECIQINFPAPVVCP